jgi:hypothetical protein
MSSVGAKVDRGRGTMRFGGDAVRSMAEAARAVGGARVVPVGILGEVWPGDAVWARLGGGGGAAGFVASAPAFLFTQRLSSLSYTKLLSSPSVALTGPLGPSLLHQRLNQPDDCWLGFIPGRDCGLVCSTFGSGTAPLPMPESFDEALGFPEEFPKPRSSSSATSCVVRVEVRNSDPDAGTTGIGDPSINDTKPEGEDGRPLGNIEAVGVVVVDSSVLEEPHQVPALEPAYGDSLSGCS